MYCALNVAKYVIHYCKHKRYFVSNLKLQKILYFIQAEFLVELDIPCFYESIEAWDFGPVVPDVYQEYKHFGSTNIIDSSRAEIYFSDKEKQLMQGIIDECSNYSDSQLVEIIHRQLPWVNAYQKYYNNYINNDSIKQYFKS